MAGNGADVGERAANQDLMQRLERDARLIAARFALRYRALEPERANVRRRYGVCYADGRIKIRLRHAVTGRPLRYSSLVNTLCHELAHLRHFHHGERFQIFYRQLLEYARTRGIYRPGRREPGRETPAGATGARSGAWEGRATAAAPAAHTPVQLGLFG